MENCNRIQNSLRPFKNMDSFFDQSLNRFWSNDSVHEMPSYNIKANEDNYIIELVAPGLMKSDFEIKVVENTLSIAVNQKEGNNTNENQKGKYLKREFSFAKFTRKFQLDKSIQNDNIVATYENGILSVVLQKNKVAKVIKHIEIV